MPFNEVFVVISASHIEACTCSWGFGFMLSSNDNTKALIKTFLSLVISSISIFYLYYCLFLSVSHSSAVSLWIVSKVPEIVDSWSPFCVIFLSAHGTTSKSVQSSSLWSGLISHLRSSVTVKRRRVHLKTHSDCFLGSEAVDVVAEHINCVKGSDGVFVCVCSWRVHWLLFQTVSSFSLFTLLKVIQKGAIQTLCFTTGANVSRDNAVCVCQALLDCSVFQSVGTKVFGKDKKQDEFQDSKTALYRLDMHKATC